MIESSKILRQPTYKKIKSRHLPAFVAMP